MLLIPPFRLLAPPGALQPRLQVHALINAAMPGQRARGAALTVGSAPTAIGSPGGPGFRSGHFVGTSLYPSSGGAGASLDASFVEHVVFTVLSNAAQEGITSIGVSATDAGPIYILQNNSGTLRAYVNGGYSNIGTLVVGRTYVATFSYSDFTPYPSKCYLNGVLAVTSNGYRLTGANTYVGSGFPAGSTNAAIHLYAGYRGRLATDAEIYAEAADIYAAVFQTQATPVPEAAGGGTGNVGSVFTSGVFGSNVFRRAA